MSYRLPTLMSLNILLDDKSSRRARCLPVMQMMQLSETHHVAGSGECQEDVPYDDSTFDRCTGPRLYVQAQRTPTLDGDHVHLFRLAHAQTSSRSTSTSPASSPARQQLEPKPPPVLRVLRARSLPAAAPNSTKLAPALPRPLLIAFAALVGAYILFFRSGSVLERMSSASASASATGWHARAQPHPDRAAFAPTRDKLVFAVLLNAPADPEGFTLALFRPDVAVDARGRVLQVKSNDFATLADLAEQTTRLPETGSFMNAWRVAHDRTSMPIDRLFVPVSGGDIKETSVQGWHPEKKLLKDAVADYQELPPVLHELFGYIQEGREGYERGHEENKELIAQIKALVEN
ncbi:hypothetical protein C8Q77DRAFT_1094818 [Trametes polyzona]|nr:hypothetical protein C8Q77DRAFT_1094818 [Trametes polyzona]